MVKKYLNKGDHSGHKEVISETLAKLALWKNRINVYNRFLDVDGVDMIVRLKKQHGTINYKEIQVKYSQYYDNSKDYWFSIRKKAFDSRAGYYYMFICRDEDCIFIIPSTFLGQRLDQIPSQNYGKYYSIRIVNRKEHWWLKSKMSKKDIHINKFHNEYNDLKDNSTVGVCTPTPSR